MAVCSRWIAYWCDQALAVATGLEEHPPPASVLLGVTPWLTAVSQSFMLLAQTASDDFVDEDVEDLPEAADQYTALGGQLNSLMTELEAQRVMMLGTTPRDSFRLVRRSVHALQQALTTIAKVKEAAEAEPVETPATLVNQYIDDEAHASSRRRVKRERRRAHRRGAKEERIARAGAGDEEAEALAHGAGMAPPPKKKRRKKKRRRIDLNPVSGDEEVVDIAASQGSGNSFSVGSSSRSRSSMGSGRRGRRAATTVSTASHTSGLHGVEAPDELLQTLLRQVSSSR